MPSSNQPGWIVVGHADAEGTEASTLELREVTSTGAETARHRIAARELPETVAGYQVRGTPRWVWSATPQWYSALVAAGIRVARCHDLRLCHAIIRDSSLVPFGISPAADAWSASAEPALVPAAQALFELDASLTGGGGTRNISSAEQSHAEFSRQQAAVAASTDPGRLRLLLAAESAGALIAAELYAAGVPWDVEVHERILTEALGKRPLGGGLPERMRALADQIRQALGDPELSLDSQPKLLRALHRSGIPVQTTGKWQLAEHEHPVIEPLLEYKRMSRLLSANGWAWLTEWVHAGRFRPVYLPGGVVTGRWASSGGGALQLPRQLRPAVRADPGWRLVIADVAQLEPRVLAAMSRDQAFAAAAYGKDLYDGIVETGVVATRQEAKIAVLGAMYGATTGDSGRLMPRLRRAFPTAMGMVDAAARAGEDGELVRTWLGRTCPPPDLRWIQLQSAASEDGATETDRTFARRAARDRGRFTRNFIVQGTAAEWALAWLADVRGRLAALPGSAQTHAPASGPLFRAHPHLAFFLHDEIIVHTPTEYADQVAVAVTEAADAAGRLLFGEFPLDFRLDVKIAESADK